MNVENMESEDLSDMSFSKDNENKYNININIYSPNNNNNNGGKNFKELLYSLIEGKDEETIKQLLLLAVKKDIISEKEIPSHFFMPTREDRINRRRHSFTISEEYNSSEKFSKGENKKLSIAKSERKKVKEKDILNRKKFHVADKHRKIIKLVESKYNVDNDDSQASSTFNPHMSMSNIKLNIPKNKSISPKNSYESMKNSYENMKNSYENQKSYEGQKSYEKMSNSANSIINSSFNSSTLNNTNPSKEILLPKETLPPKEILQPKPPSNTNSIPIQKIIQQNNSSLSEFLRSGEVEPVYDYYLRLYHDIDEYNRVEISLKKEKMARRIYEQYLKRNAPMKVNLPSKTYELFEFKFTPMDNNLFADVVPKITTSLSIIKSKFMSSKYFVNTNSIMVPSDSITRDSIGITKLAPISVHIKQTLPENLQSILNDEEVLLRFRLYLEKLFCEDALALWLRIDHIVLYIDQLTQEELKEILMAYHKEYIDETATHQIAVTFQLKELWKTVTSLSSISENDIIKLVVNTREELSKEINNHVFDFLKEVKEQSSNPKKQPTQVVGIESILKEDKVHDQLIKICINESLNKQFEAFLLSKNLTSGIFFWQAVEDLRSEAKEAKRREKAHVYYKRFISKESGEAVNLTLNVQNELEKMILNKKIFLEMKTFDAAQKQIEIILQPHVIEFLNLPLKSRQSLSKERLSGKSSGNLTLSKKSFLKFSSASNLTYKNNHEKLVYIDDNEHYRESFLDFLTDKAVKNNFLFWSDTQKMLAQPKLSSKLKMVGKIYKKYLKENVLRLKSNFKDDLALFFHNNFKGGKIEEVPTHLFTNLLIEIEISLNDLVDQYINEMYRN
eukprot:TRINITY_DN2113_c0_g3_i1.p1 TRINITY_DN2113_c0_g3~~TRINITY_DN2113_c0_g3_i1.p1  ORF type:complete len:847 (+),score=244.81 TRINITY_DN2113_c0_g3_i1:165-2705(+)